MCFCRLLEYINDLVHQSEFWTLLLLYIFKLGNCLFKWFHIPNALQNSIHEAVQLRWFVFINKSKSDLVLIEYNRFWLLVWHLCIIISRSIVITRDSITSRGPTYITTSISIVFLSSWANILVIVQSWLTVVTAATPITFVRLHAIANTSPTVGISITRSMSWIVHL